MLCFEIRAAFAVERDAAGTLAKFCEYTPLLVEQPQGRRRPPHPSRHPRRCDAAATGRRVPIT